jgi:hypothetical protein
MPAKISVESTIPTQTDGDKNAEVVEINRSVVTKVKVWVSNNKKLFVGFGTGLAMGTIGILINNRLASRDEVDETLES